LHFYPDVYRLWTHYESLKQRTRVLLARGEGRPSVYHEAAEMLLARGFDAVVFGHTHQAEDVVLGSHGRYLNCGNWVRGGSFVEIDRGTVNLRRWGD
jgi:UDP-2,3-diacylglucosamine pyrophosphatase LpxH